MRRPARRVVVRLVVHRPLQGGDHSGHRVQEVRPEVLAEPVPDERDRVDDRVHPEPRHQRDLDEVLGVAVAHVERRDHQRQRDREEQSDGQRGDD